jgi:PAP2 superfamily C-terminal
MNSPDVLPVAVESDVRAHKVLALKNGLALRILITVIALAAWFWTQSLLGARSSPTEPIGDGIHRLTATWNAFFQAEPRAANALLIVSSALIDAFGIFLLGSWIFTDRLRPFLGLAILLVTRQVMQALCSLPPPAGIIWHYPGFPSLLVTYGVANDFFFSGHTAIAVFGATELARFRRKWLTTLAVSIVIFEIAAVLILRAHYTMDVFAGVFAALWAAQVCEKISSRRLRSATERVA